ncbi:MAG: alcohol dehydrogenase, partial [Promethearchaeota archaeon]
MAKTSRAAVVPKPSEDLVIEEYELPKLEPGAALMKVGLAGCCGTDVHLWHGRLAGVPYPLIL